MDNNTNSEAQNNKVILLQSQSSDILDSGIELNKKVRAKARILLKGFLIGFGVLVGLTVITGIILLFWRSWISQFIIAVFE